MFSSFRLRSFLMAFTSAFLAFLLFWMAVLMLAHPSAALSNVQPLSLIHISEPTRH